MNKSHEMPPITIRRLERKHEAKNWVELYNNTVRNKLDEREIKIYQRREERQRMFRDDDDDDQSVYSLATLSVRTDVSRAFLTTGDPKRKLLSNLGNKKVADVLLEQPPTLPIWHPHWGNQLLCYVCSQPALHDSVSCGSCNNIAHTRCVQEIGRENRDAVHNCMQCLEQFYIDKWDYEERMRRLKVELLRNHCASIIQRRIRVFLGRRAFLRKQAAVRKLQAIVRGNIYMTRYIKRMRGKLRLVMLTVNPAYNISDSPHANSDFLNNVLVTITVYDPHKNIQYFRMERAFRSLQETAITLPGVNFFMNVIFTLAVRDELKAYQMIAQSQFALGDILYPARPTEFVLRFSPRITWVPQEAFGIKFAHLVSSNRVNYQLRHFREELAFRVRYLPQNPVTTSCQYIHGPPLDVLRRGGDMNRLSKHRSTAGTQSQQQQYQHTNATDACNQSVSDNSSMGLHSLATSLNDLVHDRPPSPEMLNALQTLPPLSHKKKPKFRKQNNNNSHHNSKQPGASPSSDLPNKGSAAAAVAASQSSGNYRASQYWMALYNLKLLFYQFHGDIEPRFSVELHDVHVILSKEVGRTYCMVSLQFSDGRIWHLEFNDRKSAVLFDIAIHESKKAYRENNSIYMRQEDFSDDVSIGFR